VRGFSPEWRYRARCVAERPRADFRPSSRLPNGLTASPLACRDRHAPSLATCRPSEGRRPLDHETRRSTWTSLSDFPSKGARATAEAEFGLEVSGAHVRPERRSARFGSGTTSERRAPLPASRRVARPRGVRNEHPGAADRPLSTIARESISRLVSGTLMLCSLSTRSLYPSSRVPSRRSVRAGGRSARADLGGHGILWDHGPHATRELGFNAIGKSRFCKVCNRSSAGSRTRSALPLSFAVVRKHSRWAPRQRRG